VSSTQQLKDYVAKLKPGFWGKFCYYVLPFRKKVVLSNMQHVFGNILSQQEITKLAQSFYGHLLRSIGENISLRFMSENKLREQAVIIGKEIPLKLAEQKKGIAVLTGHFGNWELAPIAGIMNFQQFQGKFHFVRKQQSPPVEKILFRRYYQAGLKVIPKKNSLNQVCDALADGEVVVFVMDQHASTSVKDGIAVDFFGKKAGTYRSLAMIARYTDVPVIPACSYRQADGKHVLQFLDPIPWIACENQNEELHLNTRAYNEALEKMILAHPDQWLWLHKRWKL